jgi:hypothetical protein
MLITLSFEKLLSVTSVIEGSIGKGLRELGEYWEG